MEKVKTAMEYHDEYLISKGRYEGKLKGKIEASFESALKVKRKFGIKEALELFDFTREELESETLNRPELTYP